MNLNTQGSIAGLFLAAALGGCASLAPVQLVEARGEYTDSANGLAGKLVPADVYEARKALDRANLEFDKDGDTEAVRDYAYIAQRKIAIADVKARTERDRQQIAINTKAGVTARDNQVRDAKQELADTREQLKDERTANDVSFAQLHAAVAIQGKELEKSAAELEAEKQARLTAEIRLAGAMKALATVAAVKEEQRGLVITLSAGALFAAGRTEVLESAKSRLDQVAGVLMAQRADRTTLVEGHTDNRGAEAKNEAFSLDRAQAVRDYLVFRGVDAGRISASGAGSSRPVLDNRNARNRANNRRIEIIVQPAGLSVR